MQPRERWETAPITGTHQPIAARNLPVSNVTVGIAESRKPTGCMPSIITQFRSRFTDFVFNAILTDFTYMYLVHRKESRERPFCCQSGVCFFMAFSSFNFSIISYKPITVMKLYSLFTYGEAPWSSG